MKKALIAVVLLLVVLYGVVRLTEHRRKTQEHACVARMNMLYSAAASLCLESKKGPDAVWGMAKLGEILPPGYTNCPAGALPYSDFALLEGPVCPYGHEFLPGEQRPLKTHPSHVKIYVIYKEHGFTNLIVERIGP